MSIPVSIDPMGTLGASPLPTGYTRLQYIEATGGQYIDTGVHATLLALFELDCASTLLGGTRINGFSSENPSTFWALQVYTSDVHALAAHGEKRYASPALADLERHVFSIDGLTGKISVDGLEQTTFTTREMPVLPSDQSNFYVGARCNCTSQPFAQHFASEKIYGVKIKTASGWRRNMVPALRQTDSKPGLFDMVTSTFFTNAGTGEFLYEL